MNPHKAILAEFTLGMDICNIEALRAKWDCDQLQEKFSANDQQKMLDQQAAAQSAYGLQTARTAALTAILDRMKKSFRGPYLTKKGFRDYN